MLQKTEKHGGMVSTLFVIILFMVFMISMFFMVLIGARVYENIDTRVKDNYSGSVSLGYITNKVRQSDIDGMVNVITVEDTPVLELAQNINGVIYTTWIYYYDGNVCELFTRPDAGLGLDAGLKILECDGLNLTKDGDAVRIETTGTGAQSVLLSLRSGREIHE